MLLGKGSIRNSSVPLISAQDEVFGLLESLDKGGVFTKAEFPDADLEFKKINTRDDALSYKMRCCEKSQKLLL